MSLFSKTPSFMAVLSNSIYDMAQATQRSLCAAHVGRRTQQRIRKVTP